MLMPKLNLRWGIELEWVSNQYTKLSLAEKAWDAFNFVNGKVPVELGADSSVTNAKGFEKDWGGYEFRTIDTFLWTRFPSSAVRTMLAFIAAYGGRVTPTCGLHFHFSGVTLSEVEFEVLKETLRKTHYWKTRTAWCACPANSRAGGDEARYQPARIVSRGHYEARVFNASTSFHGILQPWLFLNRVIEEIVTNRNHVEA